MPSISCRWSAAKVCARVGVATGSASIIVAAKKVRARNFDVISMSFVELLTEEKRALSFIEGDDVVGFYPAGRSNRKSGLCPGGQLARRLVVAAREGGLGRREIGFCIILVVAV